MGNGIMIQCSKCSRILIRGKTLVNGVKVFDYNFETGEIKYGIMCQNCGHYISEEKLREVIERWKIKRKTR